MYNNDITYDERWNTSENRKYLRKLEDKYLHRSECSASCPVSWAKDVHDLFEHLNSEFGIAYNETSIDGFMIKGSLIKDIFIRPIVGFMSSIYSALIKPYFSEDYVSTYYRKMSLSSRIGVALRAFYYPIEYGARSIMCMTIYPLLNKIRKPKIVLSQIKEKYGELNIYFTAPDWLKEHLDLKIRETELKLAMKGCYYPVESFYYASTSWYCGTQFHPTEYATKIVTHNDGSSHINVEMYTYREAMANLGLNLNDIKALADTRVSNNLKR